MRSAAPRRCHLLSTARIRDIERARVARMSEKEKDRVAGYVLALVRRIHDRQRAERRVMLASRYRLEDREQGI
jgi:hypothetical protein